MRNMFKQKLNATLEALKLAEKAKKNELTKSDWKKIAAKYKEMHGSDMYDDISEEQQRDNEQEEQQQAAMAILASVDENDGEERNEDESLKGKASRVVEQNKDLKKENEALKKKMTTTILPDNSEKVEVVVKLNGRGHTETYAFGIPDDMFATTLRCNRVTVNPALAKATEPTQADYAAFQAQVGSYGQRVRTRMQELHDQGLLVTVATAGDIDYSGLANAGLGEQYVVRRTDALISRILNLPNPYAIYSLRYGVQDRELITNAFFGEFSQPYQEGEVFKGEFELKPEIGYVDDAMMKTIFKSMKWLERQYIGYLNTNGSDPVKWNMIEWALLEIAKVLNNEQYKRRLLGIYMHPIKGTPAHYMYSSTGVVYTLVRYVHENCLLPIDDEECADYEDTGTIMVDAVNAFVEKVRPNVEDIEALELHLNKNHKQWFKNSVRRKYGKDYDFGGPDDMKVPDTGIPIRWVPNLGQTKLMLLQLPGNIQCLENLPGEMFNINFEQAMENVKTWSVWKEGVSAAWVGKHFDSVDELKSNNFELQQVFINKPASTLAADADSINGALNFWFVTGENTADKAFTDILNAKEGIAYIVECGSETKPQTIAKAGKFDTITAAYTPTKVGDYIMVAKRGEKFYELERCVGGVRKINAALQPNVPGAR